jgi:signal transduction histidine kinase/ActR/RegA family two-component response regulator
LEVGRVNQPLLALPINREEDVVAARQQARELAKALGFEQRDQARIAAAVSEIARNALAHASAGRVGFALDDDKEGQCLAVEVRDEGPGIADLDAVLDAAPGPDGVGMGLIAARRLMDDFRVTSQPGAGTTVWMAKRLSASDTWDAARLAGLLGSRAPPPNANPMTEICVQNKELLASLAELRLRQDELDRVNTELEDTNRGVVALYAELDERAEQLRLASELKSRFLSNMSHEFRTPLNSILAIARLLLDQTDGSLNSEQQQQVNYIVQAAQSLTDMVNDLLDLAKVEAGKLEVTPNLFTAAELFGALRGLMRPLRTSDAVDLVFEDAGHCPPLFTDEAKVSQVLRNLVSNALKFTERGEVRVSVDVDAVGKCCTFIVRDTGVGIAAEDQERIFQEFAQVRNRLQSRVKGTGLGLPLARRLAELLGGSLEVQSRLSKGSTFRFSIPYRADAPKAAQSATAVGPADDHRRVLVADDEEAFRYLLRHLLADRPELEIIEAANGADALRLIRQFRPDAVFLDLRMPILDGYEVLARLRSDPELCHVPVTVCTSSILDQGDRARLAGVVVLSKASLDRAAILASLEAALGSRERW